MVAINHLQIDKDILLLQLLFRRYGAVDASVDDLEYFSFYVVVIAQQLFSYRQLSRLRKSATAAGLSHRSCTVSCVGWL